MFSSDICWTKRTSQGPQLDVKSTNFLPQIVLSLLGFETFRSNSWDGIFLTKKKYFCSVLVEREKKNSFYLSNYKYKLSPVFWQKKLSKDAASLALLLAPLSLPLSLSLTHTLVCTLSRSHPHRCPHTHSLTLQPLLKLLRFSQEIFRPLENDWDASFSESLNGWCLSLSLFFLF